MVVRQNFLCICDDDYARLADFFRQNQNYLHISWYHACILVLYAPHSLYYVQYSGVETHCVTGLI